MQLGQVSGDATTDPSGRPSLTPPVPRAIGDLIRSYRLRQRQIHNGRPWAQEDLAVAIGTDKSHINRIERGHQQPSRETVLRISNALELSRDERTHLLGWAGYLLEPDPPTADEVERVRSLARPLLDAVPYPVGLVDEESRNWDMNDLNAYAFCGHADRETCLRAMGSRPMIELLFSPDFGPWWRRTLLDYETFVRRHVARFRRVVRVRQHVPEYRRMLDGLLADPRFAALWAEAPESSSAATPSFLDHQRVRIDHPELGLYTVDTWWSTLVSDDRFSLGHHVPSDESTARLFADLAARLRATGKFSG